ncbi:MAG TPA: metallophosphoesterase family protein [Candidatus Synoicihabitans sp.]|nr:metallophosphoesterase family protein [Candidatus Synoicihabitans sp.]
MKTIAHLSDLHFGTEDAAVALALAEELNATPPTLVVVSGDLTQRAREGQFRAAQSYLQSLPQPQLVVPGNHDVPLYDVARRFLAPLARYRRLIDRHVNPIFHDDSLLVVGVNTARSLTWQNGRISGEQIESLRETLDSSPAEFRVVVTHHPFIPPPAPGAAGIQLLGRAARALRVLDDQHVDLLLSGHLHEGYSGVTQPYYPTARRAIVAAQAGTAISRRVRTQPNAYNLIRLSRDQIEIQIRTWSGRAFETTATVNYCRTGATWARAA